MFGRKRRDPEPVEPVDPPRPPRPAINGGLRFAEPPPPAPGMHVHGRQAAPVPAIAEMRADEFRDMPYGGWGGEFTTAPSEPPPPPPLEPVGFPPPPWVDLDGNLDLAEALAPPQRNNEISALATMRLRDDPYDPPAPGPPVTTPPLRRPSIPEADWEAEAEQRAERDRLERERLARERRDEVLREILAEDDQAYPKPKRQATKEENLR